jgi:acetamidase/formamidase
MRAVSRALSVAAFTFAVVSARAASSAEVKPTHVLSAEKTHNKFSRTIPPVLRVPSGAVIQVETKEATDGQLNRRSRADDILNVQFDPVHPLTGPVFVEGANVGDVLAVTLHRIEVGSWGWVGVFPSFGLLSDEFSAPYLKTFAFDDGAATARFGDKIVVPLRPFAGVMGVAPATDDVLSTIPPRANGGNMDNPCLVAGTTVYFPVLVEGALFSIGDTHAAQGMGEVCGTGIEAPMTIVYQVEALPARPWIKEPHYETKDDYAVTAFGATLDEATRKVTRYMIEYLTQVHHLAPVDAYVLCSLAGNIHVAEVVDLPHVLVSMHISKKTLGL